MVDNDRRTNGSQWCNDAGRRREKLRLVRPGRFPAVRIEFVAERDFDPGAKYHVAANVPYMRYFLAYVLEFQLHRSWCRAAGWTGPLYRCSVYGNRAAGQQLARMLAAGQSKPWQEILAEATGERQTDATAIVDYFQPLVAWLERQNQGKPVGW